MTTASAIYCIHTSFLVSYLQKDNGGSDIMKLRALKSFNTPEVTFDLATEQISMQSVSKVQLEMHVACTKLLLCKYNF